MKKLLSILSGLICSLAVFGQTTPTFPSGLQVQNLGAPTNMVFTRNIQGANAGLAWYGSFSDTSSANSSNFYSQIAGMTIRTGDTLWIRNDAKTRWDKFGAGATYFDTTTTIIPSGGGSASDPKRLDLIVSQQAGNILQVYPDGVYATIQTTIPNGLISGGLVVWQTGLTYIITPAQYAIGGVIYNSPETTITLDNADPTDPRIDAFVVTSDETAVDITGTPAADPQNPSFDPETQLPLTFVLVSAGMTEPTYCRDSIYYISNGQTWTGVASNTGRINTTSTNNPYSVTEDVEFTLARNNDQYRVTKSSTISFATYRVLAFQIRSKATWPTNSRVNIRAYSGLTPLGVNVALGDGIFGFNSSITNAYQLIAIPIGNLGGGLSTADNILFTISTTSNNTIGFYLDDIQLLGCDGTPIPVSGSFWNVGGNTQGTTLVGGSLDNFPVQLITNNANALNLTTAGHAWLQKSNPGVSFQLGTLASADNYLRRSGTTMILNASGAIANSISGSNIYTYNATDGHTWYSASATQRMILNQGGNLLLGSLTNNANTIFNITSTTKGSHPAPSMTAVQMNAIVTPLTGDLVFNTTAGVHYYYNGAAWVALGGTTVTASNGLSLSGSDVQLGGSALSGNTSILTSAFSLTIPSSNATSTLAVTNSSSGTAVEATSSSGIGVWGASTSGVGVYAVSTNANAIEAVTTDGTAFVAFTNSAANPAGNFTLSPASTNTVRTLINLSRATSGTGASGIGGSIDYNVNTSVQGRLSNRLISKWTDATDATRTSEFSITGVNATITTTILVLGGDGSMTLGPAYQGLGAGYLAVSNTGVVTWSAGGGGGGGDALTANPLSQFAATTSAQFAGVISDETGTGLVVLATNPVLVTPNLGTPSAATLTNATGLPIATGISGLGTGVATALAINTGSAGAIVLFNGALGTPSSGTLTNATGLPIVAGTTGTLTETRGGTNQTTYTTGDILYASAANTLSKLAIGTNGQLLRVSAGGIPEWFTSGGGTGTVTSITLTQPASGFTVTNSGVAATTVGTFTFALNNDLAAVEGLATTGIVRRTGTNTWTAGTAVSLTTEVTGTLAAGNGGTGFTGSTANGQLLIGNGTTWSRATLTGTANQINVTNGSGTITLSMAFNPTVQSLADAATITWNVTNGGNAQVTLGSTGRTLSITNPVAGYTYTIEITQGSGGSKTITTWPTGTRWTGGTTPTLSTTAGQRDVVSLYYNGSNYYGTFLPNMN